jgi:hypothetical protein
MQALGLLKVAAIWGYFLSSLAEIADSLKIIFVC